MGITGLVPVHLANLVSLIMLDRMERERYLGMLERLLTVGRLERSEPLRMISTHLMYLVTQMSPAAVLLPMTMLLVGTFSVSHRLRDFKTDLINQ
jgi:hypothetical protein